MMDFVARVFSFAACMLAVAIPESAAENLSRVLIEPPMARIQRIAPGDSIFEQIEHPNALPQALPSANTMSPGDEATVNLTVDYIDGEIFNPSTGHNDKVRLRGYKDSRATVAPKIPFVAPTIEIAPGETVRLTLTNNLPAKDESCEGDLTNPNKPHCFNSTNLHSHGLWVSPTGNSDNVLLRILPHHSFQYEYNVSLQHPSGTFWYHPHLHGSTALQVSSGMAGFLIVRGNRLPDVNRPGDIDTLLREENGNRITERPLLLQQIQYSCDGTFDCTNKVGGIENYKLFGPGVWQSSGRFTSINGEVLPTFPAGQAGRIERWRLVHAGVRDSVKLQLRKKKPQAPSYAAAIAANSGDAWIDENCPGEPLPHFVIASDGLTRAAASQRTTTTLQPGYREDLLVIFPEKGTWCVIDDFAPASTTVNKQTKSRRFLGEVEIGAGQAVDADLKAELTKQLVQAADRTMPPKVRERVKQDLKDGLKLSAFVPHPQISDTEKTGEQTADFAIVAGPSFQINGESYKPDRIDRTLPLGGVEQWTLTANAAANHPFHIHVNPFEIFEILDPQGKDVSVTGEADDPQYADLKGVWRDTILVKSGYRVVMRTRYERYIGEFVLHCHILDHEDQGMMQNIRIGLPDGNGGVLPSHH